MARTWKIIGCIITFGYVSTILYQAFTMLVCIDMSLTKLSIQCIKQSPATVMDYAFQCHPPLGSNITHHTFAFCAETDPDNETVKGQLKNDSKTIKKAIDNIIESPGHFSILTDKPSDLYIKSSFYIPAFSSFGSMEYFLCSLSLCSESKSKILNEVCIGHKKSIPVMDASQWMKNSTITNENPDLNITTHNEKDSNYDQANGDFISIVRGEKIMPSTKPDNTESLERKTVSRAVRSLSHQNNSKVINKSMINSKFYILQKVANDVYFTFIVKDAHIKLFCQRQVTPFNLTENSIKLNSRLKRDKLGAFRVNDIKHGKNIDVSKHVLNFRFKRQFNNDTAGFRRWFGHFSGPSSKESQSGEDNSNENEIIKSTENINETEEPDDEENSQYENVSNGSVSFLKTRYKRDPEFFKTKLQRSDHDRNESDDVEISFSEGENFYFRGKEEMQKSTRSEKRLNESVGTITEAKVADIVTSVKRNEKKLWTVVDLLLDSSQEVKPGSELSDSMLKFVFENLSGVKAELKEDSPNNKDHDKINLQWTKLDIMKDEIDTKRKKKLESDISGFNDNDQTSSTSDHSCKSSEFFYSKLAVYVQVISLVLSLVCCHSVFKNTVRQEHHPAYLSGTTILTVLFGFLTVKTWAAATDNDTLRHWTFIPYVACYFYMLLVAIFILVRHFFCDLQAQENETTTLHSQERTDVESGSYFQNQSLVARNSQCGIRSVAHSNGHQINNCLQPLDEQWSAAAMVEADDPNESSLNHKDQQGDDKDSPLQDQQRIFGAGSFSSALTTAISDDETGINQQSDLDSFATSLTFEDANEITPLLDDVPGDPDETKVYNVEATEER